MPEEKEDKKPEKEEISERKIVVVKELPMQAVNVGTIQETGEEVGLITIEEAITEIYEDVKSIKKAVA